MLASVTQAFLFIDAPAQCARAAPPRPLR